MAATGSIRYELDGARRTFPITFPYGDHSDLLAVHSSASGQERPLVYGEDYSIIEHCLVMQRDRILPAGGTLYICLAVSYEAAEKGQEQRVLAAEASSISEAQSAWHAENAARKALEAAEAADIAVGKTYASLSDSYNGFVEQSRIEQAQTLAAIAEARDDALSGIAKIRAQALTSCEESAQRAQAAGQAEKDAVEQAKASAIAEIEAMCENIVLSLDNYGVQTMSISENEQDEISRAKEQAIADIEKARIACVESLSSTQELAQKRINELRSAIREESLTAMAQIDLLGRSQLEQIKKPGIAPVLSKADIYPYSYGFFVENPNVRENGNFQGLWQVKSLDEIAWDGFYVVLPDCPGHRIPTDWELPDPPADQTASGNDWLPCDHHRSL